MKRKIRIDGSFYLFLAAMLLMLPLRWILAAFVAAFIHELGHCFAVWMLGETIAQANVSFRGARLTAAPMSTGRELVCVLAGPAASMALVGLGRFCPRVAICALFQGIFNLLPIYPLDGGRALRCVRTLWKERRFHIFSHRRRKIPCKEGSQRVQ